MKIFKDIVLFSTSIFVLMMFLSVVSFAATFNPMTVEELINDITTANSNGEADTINLVPGMVYTITGMEPGVPFSDFNGNNGLPIILSDSGNPLTINGGGATIERDPSLFTTDPCDGAALTEFRIFQVNFEADLRLNGVTLQNGCAAEGLGNGSFGGGVFTALGTVTITNSTISGNEAMRGGGGILNLEGTIIITNSSVSDNKSSEDSGGLFIQGNPSLTRGIVEILNSTISGNVTDGPGGGLRSSGVVTIRNSTLSGNMANNGGGIFNNNGGAMTITNSTISGNEAIGGGGITNFGGSVDLKNTLIVSNSPDNCFNFATINDNGGNISDDNTDGCMFAFNADWNTATMLGSLQHNGGGTLTHALISTAAPANPAIDAIVPANCTDQQMIPVAITDDQRFFPRPIPNPGNCDVGAFELQPTGNLMVEKITINPPGGTGFTFLCGIGDLFTLDDLGSNICTLPLGMVTIEELDHPFYTVSDITCTGTPTSETNSSVTIDIVSGDNGTCTFTNIGQFDLDITLAGDGAGNVSSEPLGIECGDGGVDCMETYFFGTEVTLTPTPDAVSTFLGFTGDPDCEDGVVAINADKTCTATFNFLPLILNPIFPGVASNPNIIEVEQATPDGSVAYVWSFMAGSTTIGGPTCNGITLGLKNPKLLGFRQAGANQIATFTVFIPLNPALENPVLMQAVDIPTCRTSEVVTNIIRSE